LQQNIPNIVQNININRTLTEHELHKKPLAFHSYAETKCIKTITYKLRLTI